ncbi:hypothetical protein ACIOVF_25655 [Pseudomonas sp. NPDC087612]|uniref:hypothetical protein n=1 Tax=Pseudomonas TaxID=286 RepID=UPI0005EB86F8|nr:MULTISPECIES: hypothetical protein [unclassified Pseudomonas]KJK14422.1 hypothetical protein UB48_25410 [Pseudomonas sp. 2(2015)]QPG62021.1 hypothetical protein HFV04_021190 [Pseudomonas sp. BIGb0427]QVM94214.1 hypothetical protein JYG36_13885 [Pseudomonas sp. SORT22]UVL53903.1 hypothetical protein LOY22_13485 [Pseudomonas sp. B21-035]UVM53448.1 hypothetical protein LOY37_13765 [Pseudomonas sp. B21-012]
MESIGVLATQTNWNGGQRLTLNAGDTATCTTLSPGQLYGIFIYNSAQNQTSATVNVNWSNSQPPCPITVPGTTANAGLASIGFVSGTDTQTVSVSIAPNSGLAQVDIWLGSVSMPINTAGLNNQALQANGELYPFSKYSRYYAVPPSKWMSLTIASKITQFVSCQFREEKAVVYVINETSNGLLSGQITSIGPTAKTAGVVTILPTSLQSITNTLQGDGSQWVWMDADSAQDSQSASIALQSM